jgi:hypothetical protein
MWGERRGVRVAHPTREHGCAFMRIAAQKHLELHTRTCAAGYAKRRWPICAKDTLAQRQCCQCARPEQRHNFLV